MKSTKTGLASLVFSKKNRVLSQLYQGIRAAFLVRVLGVGMAFFAQMLFARWFGAQVFGEYVYVFTWITVLSLFARLGLDTASLKFVPAYVATAEWALLGGYIQKSRRVVLLSSLLIASIGIGSIPLLEGHESSTFTQTFRLGFTLLPFMTIMYLHAAHIQALRHPGQAMIAQDIVRPVFLLAGATLLFINTQKSSADTLMCLEIFATSVGSLVAWYLITRNIQATFTKVIPNFNTRIWFGASLPMLLISGAQLILAKADILMIGAMLGPKEAGKYAVASLLAGLVLFLINTANQVIAPTISQLFTEKKYSQLQRLVSNAALVITILTLPLVMSLVVFGSDLLLLFGTAFIDQYNVLLVLAAGQFVIVLWGSVGFLLTMTEHQITASWVIGITSMLNVVLNFILIPSMGVVGAALATSVSVSIRSIVLGVLVWRKLRVMPTIFGPILMGLISKGSASKQSIGDR